MRKKNPVEKRPVLPAAREGQAKRIGVFGILSAADGRDSIRPSPPVQASLPDPSDDFDGSIRDELMRLMKLPAALLELKPDLTITSSGALLARALLRKAVIDDNHNAMVEVLDRVEGKAVKGAQNKTNNSHISDQLDLSLDELNDLAAGEKNDE